MLRQEACHNFQIKGDAIIKLDGIVYCVDSSAFTSKGQRSRSQDQHIVHLY